MFGIGVGEGEVVELVFGGRACSMEIFKFEGRAVAATAAQGVDLLGDECVGAGVEHVQVSVGVGGRDVGESFEMGTF